jgi:hypothetical protein
MCTVTSHLLGRRLLLTMNRDEYRSRAAEHPPVIHKGADGSLGWIGPCDGQSGGTWIGANSAGVMACILNVYEADEAAPPAADDRPSRGKIIPDLLAIGLLERIDSWLLKEFTAADYAPFRLLIANSDRRTVYTWRGHGQIDKADLPEGWQVLTSSSWNGDGVVPWREERFRQWVADGAIIAGELPTYHLLQPEGLADHAPLMARELTTTRSITQIALDGVGGKTICRYWPDPTIDTLGQPPHTAIRLDHSA